MSCEPNKVFEGTAYVARIKDPEDVASVHKKQEFLHVVAYVDKKEGFDYKMLKNLVEESNKFIFYTYTINKGNRSSFKWKQCLDALALNKPIGGSCVIFHDEPVTFGKFAMMAYDHHILQDSDGYNNLLKKLNPPAPAHLPVANLDHLPDASGPTVVRTVTFISDIEAVRKGIAQAEAMNDAASDDVGTVGANYVVNDKDVEHGPMSMEYWKERALIAEAKVDGLDKELIKEKDAVVRLQKELAVCGDSKQRYSVQADLASTRLSEYKAATAEPFVSAIKPELACLPVLAESVKEM